jgi:hypothetical protein
LDAANGLQIGFQRTQKLATEKKLAPMSKRIRPRAAVGRVALKNKNEKPVMWGITDGRDRVGTVDREGRTYFAKDADGKEIGAFAKLHDALSAVNQRYDQQPKKWKRAA